jgi:spore germination cell wall hydrolase CwlJ-like protein
VSQRHFKTPAQGKTDDHPQARRKTAMRSDGVAGRTRQESNLIRFLGNRGASAVMGLFMLAMVSGQASAQAAPVKALDVSAAVRQVLPSAAKSYSIASSATAAAAPSARTAIALNPTRPSPSISFASPVAKIAAAANAITSAAGPAIAREAAWLYRAGWPLYALVDRYGAGAAALDEETACLATAVYFEARGESLEGQLAVARVVMNRAASGKYPPSWCGTVKQPWQFSFVRNGRFPAIDAGSASWRKAQAIARLAVSNVVPSLSNDVLWYHANYVAPSWGRRLTRAEKIGTHIFYRS